MIKPFELARIAPAIYGILMSSSQLRHYFKSVNGTPEFIEWVNLSIASRVAFAEFLIQIAAYIKAAE